MEIVRAVRFLPLLPWASSMISEASWASMGSP